MGQCGVEEGGHEAEAEEHLEVVGALVIEVVDEEVVGEGLEEGAVDSVPVGVEQEGPIQISQDLEDSGDVAHSYVRGVKAHEYKSAEFLSDK